MRTRRWRIEDGGWTARSVLECGGPPPLFARPPASPPPQSASELAQSKAWRPLVTLGLLIGALCGDARAQSFSIPWHTIDGGGGTSTGGVYAVSGTIGQPDAGGSLTGGQFSVTGGFWALPPLVQRPDAPTLFITNSGPVQATLWWTPATGTNWIVQERLSLSAGNWTNSPSGWTNPVVVPVTLPAKFYRLTQR